MKIEDLKDWDAAAHFADEAEIADFLSEAVAEGDPAFIQVALGVAVRAAGMMKV